MITSDDPSEILRRWTDSGAQWKVIGRHRDEVTIGLFRCDGGEEVDRITSADPRLRRFLAEGAVSQSEEGAVPPDPPRG